jgi:hypothetical protein
MLQVIREFSVGRPQIVAGLMLLVFLGQCLWVAGTRRLSDLEYEYLASSHPPLPGQEFRITSPFTGWAASVPLRANAIVRRLAPASLGDALAVPRPWVLRLPFVIFGVWLGAALWWVARRLFGDEGGYVALALYCSSPAMVMISTSIGPEIILAWSSFGLVYLAIGVAHTVYAPPRKWLPRIVLLGLSIGICISTELWAGALVLVALGFMVYLVPGRRRSALTVFACASVIGVAVLVATAWLTGSFGATTQATITPKLSLDLLYKLGFALNKNTDGSVLVALFIVALTVYGSWPRARYFGNTAPLLMAFTAVLLFALVPGVNLWAATLGLSFAFLFVGGVAADLLETRWRRQFLWIVVAFIAIKIAEDFIRLAWWVHQNAV